MMLFQNGPLNVRLLRKEDNSQLAKWLSNPTVLEFYEGRDNPFDVDKVNHVFYDEDDTVKCLIEFNNQAIGYIQFYELDNKARKLYGYSKDENIYGMDQFIGEVEYWNKGIGTILVTSMVAFLIKDKKADRVVMDPQTRNTRALKCYEKCGFKKVKILPKHELHEGEYQDCWLIEFQM